MTETQITQADRDAYAAALEKMKYARSADAVRNGFEDKHPIVQAFAAHRATRTDATPVAEAWAGMEAAMQDPDYAWGWHCNLAVPIMDATGITHEQANMAAAHLMQHLWKCDITTHPHYQYEKSGAQAYAEFRIDADKVDDAALPDAPHPPATDVAALVEAAKAMFNMPGDIDIESNPPELQREALEARRQAWNALRSALAPFTKGQNDG